MHLILQRPSASGPTAYEPACSIAGSRGSLAALVMPFGRLRDLLAPVRQAMFLEPNPIPAKASLSLAGPCGTELRLPPTSASDAALGRLEPVVSAMMAAEEVAAAPRLTVGG